MEEGPFLPNVSESGFSKKYAVFFLLNRTFSGFSKNRGKEDRLSGCYDRKKKVMPTADLGKNRDVTIMMSDLRGFTALGSMLPVP